jgi:hypothetical protein
MPFFLPTNLNPATSDKNAPLEAADSDPKENKNLKPTKKCQFLKKNYKS